MAARSRSSTAPAVTVAVGALLDGRADDHLAVARGAPGRRARPSAYPRITCRTRRRAVGRAAAGSAPFTGRTGRPVSAALAQPAATTTTSASTSDRSRTALREPHRPTSAARSAATSRRGSTWWSLGHERAAAHRGRSSGSRSRSSLGRSAVDRQAQLPLVRPQPPQPRRGRRRSARPAACPRSGSPRSCPVAAASSAANAGQRAATPAAARSAPARRSTPRRPGASMPAATCDAPAARRRVVHGDRVPAAGALPGDREPDDAAADDGYVKRVPPRPPPCAGITRIRFYGREARIASPHSPVHRGSRGVLVQCRFTCTGVLPSVTTP